MITQVAWRVPGHIPHALFIQASVRHACRSTSVPLHRHHLEGVGIFIRVVCRDTSISAQGKHLYWSCIGFVYCFLRMWKGCQWLLFLILPPLAPPDPA